MRYYVYILSDGNAPFYVGKGSGKRMYNHKYIAQSKNYTTPLYNKIRKMISEGKEIRYEVPFRSDMPEDAYVEEQKLIKALGRRDLKTGPLLNLTDGGEGQLRYVFPEERKKSLSKKIKLAIAEGRYNPSKNFENLDQQDPEYKELKSKIGKAYYKTEQGMRRRELISKQTQARRKNGKRTDLTEEGRKRLSEARRLANLKRSSHRDK